MSPPNASTQPHPPSSSITNNDRTCALLRELAASLGDAPGSQELLVSLASVESALQASNVAAPPTMSTPPLVSQDVPMDEVPAPSIEGSTAEGVSDAVNSRGVPLVESMVPGLDCPAVVVLSNVPRSPTTPPSPTPSHPSTTSTLTPSSSPARSRPPRNATPDRDELLESLIETTPPSSATTLVIPTDSPLASRARLVDPRSGSRSDTEMEWRTFEPNWRLQFVPRDSIDGGYTVYPPVACSSCVEGKAVCSGVNGVKCARCKVRHSVCSLYQDTFEGRARAKALVTGRKFVEGQVATEDPIKPEPGSTRVTRPKKRVRLLPPSSSSSPVSNDTPPPSTAHLPSTSRTLTTSDDSALAIAFAIRDAVVAAIEAFDHTLEEQGLSSKARGKRRARD